MNINQSLGDISELELERMGLIKVPNSDFDKFYFLQRKSSMSKIYFERTSSGFNQRGFRLAIEKEINTLWDLIKTIDNWKNN